jgi:hypothetical protein
VADAALLAADRLGVEAVRCSGSLQREDGTEIISVRDLELDRRDGLPRIRSTKRVVFKEPVRPGDDVAIVVRVEPC